MAADGVVSPLFRRFEGLAADDWGHDEDRVPLLLLHGMTFDRTMWRGIVEQLHRIDPGRRVVSLDLPGHGDSPELDRYSTVEVADLVHAAAERAGLTAPVVVGHSAAAGIASVYASRHPSRGVINVDASPVIAPFAGFIRTLADGLRGEGFPSLWQMFFDSFHVELLPLDAQQLVRRTCRPRQRVVLGYWRELIEEPVEALTDMVQQAVDGMTAAGVPYLYVTGSSPDPATTDFFDRQRLRLGIQVWPGTGHFPHLAHPDRFAAQLAATAVWTRPTIATEPAFSRRERSA